MIYRKGYVMMRTYIIEYGDKTRCISILGIDLDTANILVWQHEYSDDNDMGIMTVGYRSLKPTAITWLDYSEPLPVPVSAVSPSLYLCLHSAPRMPIKGPRSHAVGRLEVPNGIA